MPARILDSAMKQQQKEIQFISINFYTSMHLFVKKIICSFKELAACLLQLLNVLKKELNLMVNFKQLNQVYLIFMPHAISSQRWRVSEFIAPNFYLLSLEMICNAKTAQGFTTFLIFQPFIFICMWILFNGLNAPIM